MWHPFLSSYDINQPQIYNSLCHLYFALHDASVALLASNRQEAIENQHVEEGGIHILIPLSDRETNIKKLDTQKTSGFHELRSWKIRKNICLLVHRHPCVSYLQFVPNMQSRCGETQAFFTSAVCQSAQFQHSTPAEDSSIHGPQPLLTCLAHWDVARRVGHNRYLRATAHGHNRSTA